MEEGATCVTPNRFGNKQRTKERNDEMDRRIQSVAEMKATIQGALDDFSGLISGPVYRGLNKQLAELYLEEGDELSAVFHLTEALGTTFRQRACFRFACNNLNKGTLQPDEDQTIGLHMDWLKLDGKWNDRMKGVLSRLKDMPSEWTIVQLTLEFDPHSRFPSKAANHQLGIHITRMSCGSLSADMSDIGEGGPPISILVPPLINEENCTLMEEMQKIVGNLKNRKLLCSRQKAKLFDWEVSSKIEGVVHDMETWLNGWQCFLGGRLIDEDLQQSIKLDIDKLLLDYEFIDTAGGGVKRTQESPSRGACLPNRTMKVLYLLATTPHISLKQLYLALNHLLLDKALVKHIGKGIKDILQAYKTKLLLAQRHPVILLVDEELDLLPFEMMQSLKDHPVSRMPSLHLLHALYHKHKDTTLRCGVNTQNGFFIVNPDQDLPWTEATMKQIFSHMVPSWNGITGMKPSSEEFKAALQDHSVLLYCGHGGGSQYLLDTEIEKISVNAVVMLFGCASNQILKLGGNVEGHSLFNAYLMAGSPCVVGMLWSVLDRDTTEMSHGVLQSWIGYSAVHNSGADSIENLQGEFNRVLNLGSPGDQRNKSELLRAVCEGRNEAQLYLNRAALIVRGLPIFAATTVIQKKI